MIPLNQNLSTLKRSAIRVYTNLCHCEPVRTLAWKSPELQNHLKIAGDCHVAALLAMTC